MRRSREPNSRRSPSRVVAGLVLGAAVVSASLVTVARADSKTPDPMITGGPSGPVASTSATFTFTGSATPVTFRCRLDAGPFSVCTSPAAYTGLVEGPHTFTVNATAPGATVSRDVTRAWAVDTLAPPAPVLTNRPDDPTDKTNAQFNWKSSEDGLSYECRRNAEPYTGCTTSGVDYKDLSFGDHCLSVRAVDLAGNTGPTTTFCWRVRIDAGFLITGNTVGLLAPGVSRPVDLVIHNPFNYAIKVTSVAVTIGSAPGCPAAQNFALEHSLIGTVTVPANTARSLSALGVPEADWPLVRMVNLPTTNQDACKNTSVTLTYSGTAEKP